MNYARYIVAKFIPDLQRMEPRNIGVVLWTPDGIAARFLKEKIYRLGEVDGRSVPSWIQNFNAYKQWVKFWRTEIEKDAIEPYTGGEAVDKNDERFLDVLLSSGHGNFVLVNGGILLDSVEKADLQDVVDYLFKTIVATDEDNETRDVVLSEVCDRLIAQVNLKVNPYFKPSHPVWCQVGNTRTQFEFNYYYGNGHPKRLFQRVPMGTNQRDAYVHNAAYMFEKVIGNHIIAPDQGGVLIYVTDEHMENKKIRNSVELLGSITRVFNLNDEQELVEELTHLPIIDEEADTSNSTL